MTGYDDNGEATFPGDANGDVLRRLLADGDDFSVARDIDYSIIFRDAKGSEAFAAHFRGLGYEVSVEPSELREGFPWDVRVVKHMLPTHAGITQFEQQLSRIAEPLGGENDGWGCFAQNEVARSQGR